MANKVIDVLNQEIENFNKKISNKYNISLVELNNMWYEANDSEPPKESIPTYDYLNSLKKNDLKAKCKSMNIKITSKNKEQLIQGILDEYNNNNEEVVQMQTKFQHKPDEIHIRTNKFGNLEHFETGLIFDKENKIVIGKQDSSGSIKELSKNDIEICNKFHFEYEMPSNLEDEFSVKTLKASDTLEEDEVEDDDEFLEEDDEFLDEEEEDGEEDEFIEEF